MTLGIPDCHVESEGDTRMNKYGNKNWQVRHEASESTGKSLRRAIKRYHNWVYRKSQEGMTLKPSKSAIPDKECNKGNNKF